MTAKDCNGRKIEFCFQCDDMSDCDIIWKVGEMSNNLKIPPDCPLEDWRN